MSGKNRKGRAIVQTEVPQKEWNLERPSEAREFLRQVRIGPAKARIKFLRDEHGQDISLDDASDTQVLQTVREMFLGGMQ